MKDLVFSCSSLCFAKISEFQCSKGQIYVPHKQEAHRWVPLSDRITESGEKALMCAVTRSDAVCDSKA